MPAKGAKQTEGQRRSQIERAEIAERSLIEAALELISFKGAAGVTLGEVGIKAGYSRGLSTYHFGTKLQLLRAVADTVRERANSDVEREPPSEGLSFLLSHANRYASLPRPTEMRAMHMMQAEAMTSESDLHHQMLAFNHDSIEIFATHIQKGIENGEIPPATNPEHTAVMILSLLRGLSLLMLIDPTGLGDMAQSLDISREVKGLLGISEPASGAPPPRAKKDAAKRASRRPRPTQKRAGDPS